MPRGCAPRVGLGRKSLHRRRAAALTATAAAAMAATASVGRNRFDKELELGQRVTMINRVEPENGNKDLLSYEFVGQITALGDNHEKNVGNGMKIN